MAGTALRAARWAGVSAAAGWGARTFRALAKAFRLRGLPRASNFTRRAPALRALREVRFGRMPKPTRWKRALPGPHRLAPLARRMARSAIPTRVICCALLADSALAAVEHPPQTGPTVPGSKATVSWGKCVAPANAPLAVKRAIWASNYLVGRPYVWGGGHGTFYDRGYDCSGSVSFLLHHAGVIAQPVASKELQTFGEPGPGQWITIYARNGHTFAIVCGVRLDTTGPRGDDEGPRWRRNDRGPSGFVARHPPGL